MSLFNKKDWKTIISGIVLASVIGSITWCLSEVRSILNTTNMSKTKIIELEKNFNQINKKVNNLEVDSNNTKKEINSIKIVFEKQSIKLDNIKETLKTGLKRSQKRLDDVYRVMLQLKRTENIDSTPSSLHSSICSLD